ncbi:uncharacterized protein LOC141643827 [Silene latifolia]|uniref:uncharacterized protein LOC141643827 n=1 Tax=Silene latifolia TaxID=37657 RepID=UPI003D778398
MAIATTMNLNNVDINANSNTNTDTNTNTNTNSNKYKQQQEEEEGHQEEDEHGHDMVMPGFRFHPTEEELIEFYLRRKVEGKRFNVELITFLDLYRYDPWELPAMAAIGEKEWYFYVPRDRKYRNGDRPNRVTTSGYWKATGADRMIRGETLRPIGLKKTLVFYSGKAPKGIRTSWIMNEYRLPQHETERYQKAEISLCRVYKRAGVEDHPSAPRGMASRLSSSSRATSSSSERKNTHHNTAFRAQSSSLHHHHQQAALEQQLEKVNETDASSSTDVGTALGLSHHSSYTVVSPLPVSQPPPQQQPQPQQPITEVDQMMHMLNHHHHQGGDDRASILEGRTSNLIPSSIFLGNASTTNTINQVHQNQHQPSLEEIQRLVEYQQAYLSHHFQQHENRQQLQFGSLTSNPNNSTSTTTTTTTNNNSLLFPNYIFSQQPILVNNPPPIVGGSIGLPPPVTTTAGGGGGGGTALWEWNPFPEPNRDHFSNLFK